MERETPFMQLIMFNRSANVTNSRMEHCISISPDPDTDYRICGFSGKKTRQNHFYLFQGGIVKGRYFF